MSTSLAWEDMLGATSNGEDVDVRTTPPNWFGIFTLVGDGEVIGPGVRTETVILSMERELFFSLPFSPMRPRGLGGLEPPADITIHTK